MNKDNTNYEVSLVDKGELKWKASFTKFEDANKFYEKELARFEAKEILARGFGDERHTTLSYDRRLSLSIVDIDPIWGEALAKFGGK